jgi:hypothetical protein
MLYHYFIASRTKLTSCRELQSKIVFEYVNISVNSKPTPKPEEELSCDEKTLCKLFMKQSIYKQLVLRNVLFQMSASVPCFLPAFPFSKVPGYFRVVAIP